MKTLSFVTFAAGLLASCGGSRIATVEANGGQPAAIRVTTVAVSEQDLPATYEATGTVRARSAATISAKLIGYVQQVTVNTGDHVREHQLLIVLDARETDAARHRAEAAVGEIHAALPEADQAVAAAKAGLDLAQTTHRRMEDLRSKTSISAQEFDESFARMKAAQAAWEMARARRTQLDSKLVQAEQEVRTAAVMQGYTRIEAPFAGVVVMRSVEPGNLAVSGALLLTIEREGAYRLEASVDESRLPSVKTGQPVEVSLEALGRKLSARISEVAPALEAASHSYLVKIDLPAAPEIRSGMFGRAIFALAPYRATVAPAAGLVEHGQLQSMFVVENGIARSRLITAGARTGGVFEVLSGLRAGEQVVAPVPPALQDGAKVEPSK
jgi:RND family efflux transporter MFP subunit